MIQSHDADPNTVAPRMILRTPAIKHGILLALLLALTVAVYLPGLHGEFIFDDYENLVTNENSHLADLSRDSIARVWDSGVASTLGRPLAMLSFGLNTYFTGLDPFYFKLTNLVLHLLNGIALYFLARLLAELQPLQNSLPNPLPRANNAPRDSSAAGFALLVSALWLLHPLNVSTVLYAVQRMTIMATLASTCTLLLYCHFRLKDPISKTRAVLRLLPLALLVLVGVLSKENAVLSIAMLLLIELFFLAPANASPNPPQRLFLQTGLICFVVLPCLAALVLLFTDPAILLGDYTTRNFNLQQRVLTQTRVLWSYIYWIFLPDTRDLVFYHDNYPISRSLMAPPTTLLASAGLAALAGLVWALRTRLPFVAFGIAFFFAGHLLESTVVSLELVFEHRNYLPSFGLLLALVSLLYAVPAQVLGQQAKGLLLAGLLLFHAHGTFVEVRKWSNAYEHLLFNANQNPGSHRANYSMGFYYLGLARDTPHKASILDAASAYFRLSLKLDPDAIRGHTGLLLADTQNNKPADPVVVDDLVERVGKIRLLDRGFAELSQLTECWYGNFCRFDKAVMARIFSALANNENTPVIARQAMLLQMGSALIGLYRASEDGKALLEMASDLQPEMTVIDTQLIELLLAQGSYQDALDRIEKVRSKPATDGLRQLLLELEQQALKLASESAP